MNSELRIQASRINGAKSRGPKTPRGKSNSSRNHTKHGMLSKTIILEGEAGSRFAALLAAMREELQPQTPIQDGLVENMAACRWRQRRLWAMETAGITREILRQDAATAEENAPTRALLAFTRMTGSSRALDLISRYETRYDRQFCRSLDRFLALRTQEVVENKPS